MFLRDDGTAVRRYRAFSRRKHRQLYRAWAARNKRLLALTAVTAVVFLVGETALLLLCVRNTALRWYLLGVAHTAIIAVVLYLMDAAFVTVDQTALAHRRGAMGEENTRDVLAGARRRRLIWGWVDSVSTKSGDIDHLVVTRRGGIIAIDSKWRTAIAMDDPQKMAASARRAARRAEGVFRGHRGAVRPLTQRTKARHRDGGDFGVTPLVAVWGAAQRTVPADACIEGVAFVAGRDLRRYLRQLRGEAVDRPTAKAILDHLKDFRESAWTDEHTTKRGS